MDKIDAADIELLYQKLWDLQMNDEFCSEEVCHDEVLALGHKILMSVCDAKKGNLIMNALAFSIDCFITATNHDERANKVTDDFCKALKKGVLSYLEKRDNYAQNLQKQTN